MKSLVSTREYWNHFRVLWNHFWVLMHNYWNNVSTIVSTHEYSSHLGVLTCKYWNHFSVLMHKYWNRITGEYLFLSAGIPGKCSLTSATHVLVNTYWCMYAHSWMRCNMRIHPLCILGIFSRILFSIPFMYAIMGVTSKSRVISYANGYPHTRVLHDLYHTGACFLLCRS